MSRAFSVSKYAPAGRTPSWKVSGRAPDGAKVRRFFKTKEEAENFAADASGEVRSIGWQAMGLSDESRIEAAKCLALLSPTGRTLTEAVRHFLDHLNITERSFTVAEAVERLIDEKRAGGTLSPRYLNELATQFRPVVSKFGHRPIPSLTRAELRDWVFSRKNLSPVSRKNAVVYLRLLFNYCIKEGAAKENPADGIELGKLPAPPCGILTPEALRRLIDLTREKAADSLPGILIQAFAGLRDSEVRRLRWEEVNLADGHITITANNSKTKSRRVVDIAPNLAAFLAPIHARTGKVVTSCHRMNFATLRAALMAEKHAFPTNALRHSFVSYRLVQSGDDNRTALEAGHSVTMLHAHYKGLVNAKTAAAWWAITPTESAAGNVLPMPAPAAARGDKRKKTVKATGGVA